MSLRACDACSSIKQKCDGKAIEDGGCGRCKRLGISCDYARLDGKTVDTAKYRAITIRRVRTGCVNCKKRRKKCDGAHPRCSDCRRLNLVCERPTTSRSSLEDDEIIPDPASRECLNGWPPSNGALELTNSLDTERSLEGLISSEEVISSPQWTEPLYDWLDPTMLPSSRSSDNGSLWNGEEDPMTSMASIAVDVASIEGLLAIAGPLMSTQSEIFESVARFEPCFTSTIPPLTSQATFVASPMDRLTTREDRYLFNHYCHVVARSLCVASVQENNPFLRLVLPLATTNAAVMGALLALSACHLQHNGGSADFVRAGLDHQTKALAALHDLIAGTTAPEPGSPFDTNLIALAVVLIFCITDIRQGNSTNWLWHITAAKNMIESRTALPGTLGPSSDPWPFLLDLFEYVDSIITVSKCKPPLVDHQKTINEADLLRLSGLNPIFGVARPLIRLIGQVSALSNRRKFRVNAAFDEKFRQSAAVIDQNLRSWQPEQHLPSVVFSIHDTDLSAAFHCAEAIRYAGILRLHQVVDGYKLPNPVTTDCLTKILEHVRKIPIGSPAENSLVFPLFMAGAVSLNEEDRMTVRCRWAIIERTIGFGNVSKGRAVLTKVWDMMDEDIKTALQLGKEQSTEVNWARIRWFEFSELVLF